MESRKLFNDSHYLDLASISALRSTCLKANFGCYIVRDSKILTYGHNRPINSCMDNGCNRAGSNNGHNYENCMSIHAEAMAIARAAKEGISLLKSTLYLFKYKIAVSDIVSDSKCEPCRMCKKLIIFSGIEFVVTTEKKYIVDQWKKNFRTLLNKEGY